MNRRGFFRSLAVLAGAASVSPNIFIPKFEPVKWKVIRAYQGMYMCGFKYYILESPARFDEMIFHQRDYSGTWRFEMEELNDPKN